MVAKTNRIRREVFMKRFIKTFLLLTAAVMIAFPSSAEAWIPLEDLDSLRCGDHLVQLGETQLEVFHQCGQPDDEASYPYYGFFGPVGNLEKWTYNRGPEDFIYVFIFLNGQLKHIRQTDRGF